MESVYVHAIGKSVVIHANADELDAIRKVLTPERIRIISMIRERRPGSIYELAKMLGRNRSSVMRDLKHLSSFGLVEFDTSGKRNRKRPVVNYSEINIVIPV